MEVTNTIVMPDEMTVSNAEMLLDLKLDDSVKGRVTELSEKNNAGDITYDEGIELDHYLQAASLLDIIHSKAKAFLHTQGKLHGY